MVSQNKNSKTLKAELVHNGQASSLMPNLSITEGPRCLVSSPGAVLLRFTLVGMTLTPSVSTHAFYVVSRGGGGSALIKIQLINDYKNIGQRRGRLPSHSGASKGTALSTVLFSSFLPLSLLLSICFESSVASNSPSSCLCLLSALLYLTLISPL